MRTSIPVQMRLNFVSERDLIIQMQSKPTASESKLADALGGALCGGNIIVGAMEHRRSGFTTIHLDDVRKLPDRILNMMNNVNDAQRMENRIYRYVNAAVLIRKIESSDGKVRRYIDQLCFFSREEGKNRII